MPVLLHPAYFPNIHTFSILAQHEIIWESCDNYQKQTYRNRCYISTDQGKLMLNIPIQHVGGKEGRQLYRDVQIDYSENWLRQHWRTLQTAYRTSPFFEFYEDDLAPLFERKEKYLLDFNLRTIAVICECLQIPFQNNKTNSFVKTPENVVDGRALVHAKGEKQIEQETYMQVFGDRHGFIGNLSILDLLFNEGSRASDYLQHQKLSLDV
ncbi:MAG: WbqC family protein [Eudoraea sp.]|nr:WbqC family protein [Eudoraea sp.]